MQGKFEILGLELCNLVIENISFPENIEKALDERATLGILGDKMGVYAQKKAADALGDAVKNPGSVGAFMGVGVGQNMGGALNSVFSNIQNAEDKPKQPKKFCSECGCQLAATAKFCPECGSKQPGANVCSGCGTQLADSAKFCPECGKKV